MTEKRRFPKVYIITMMYRCPSGAMTSRLLMISGSMAWGGRNDDIIMKLMSQIITSVKLIHRTRAAITEVKSCIDPAITNQEERTAPSAVEVLTAGSYLYRYYFRACYLMLNNINLKYCSFRLP